MRLDHLLSRETGSDETGRTDSKVERRIEARAERKRKKKGVAKSHKGYRNEETSILVQKNRNELTVKLNRTLYRFEGSSK